MCSGAARRARWAEHRAVCTPPAPWGLQGAIPALLSPLPGPAQPHAALPIPAAPGQDRAALRGGAGRRQHLHGSPHGPGQAAPALHPGSELTPHPLTGVCHPAPAGNTTPELLTGKPWCEMCARLRCRVSQPCSGSSLALEKLVSSMGLGGQSQADS